MHKYSEHKKINTLYYYYIKELYMQMFKISKERRICGIFKSNNFKKILNGRMKTTLPFKNISIDIYGPFSLDEYICPPKEKRQDIFLQLQIYFQGLLNYIFYIILIRRR